MSRWLMSRDVRERGRGDREWSLRSGQANGYPQWCEVQRRRGSCRNVVLGLDVLTGNSVKVLKRCRG